MQHVLWCTLILAVGAADETKVLEVGKGLNLNGTLDKGKPQQVYHVKLHKGGTYVIDMVSPDPKALDPFLRVLDASGKMLAADDDSGGNLNARILFLAPATGTYPIVASSVDSPGVGSFTLAVNRDDSRKAQALEARKAAETKLDALDARVQFLTSAGKSAAALAAARESVKARERLQGATHWQTVSSRWQVRILEKIASLSESEKTKVAVAEKLDARALQLHHKAKYAEAAPLFKKSLATFRKIMGEEHPYTATSSNYLALNLRAQGKYTEAEPLLENALAIRRKAFGEAHPATAGTYSNLALILRAQSKYAEAAPLLEKALAIFRETVGEEHSYTGTSYLNLAINLRSQGKGSEAAPLLQKALAIHRKTLGEDHLDTARDYHNLAAHLSTEGKYAEAAPYYEKALAIGRQNGREEHPDQAQFYNNLAANLGDQGKYAEAAPLIEKA
jgi:tetratricopeptide (TPR) repeat protein